MSTIRRRLTVLLCSLALLSAGVGVTAASASTSAPAAPAAVVAATPAAGTVVMVTPARIADSRSWSALSTFWAFGSEDLQVVGRGGVPLTGVSGIILVVTAVPVQDGMYSQGGYLTVWPTQGPRPEVSQVSFPGWQNVSTEAMVGPLDSGGSVRIFNGSPGYVDVLVDVVGYVAGSVPN